MKFLISSAQKKDTFNVFMLIKAEDGPMWHGIGTMTKQKQINDDDMILDFEPEAIEFLSKDLLREVSENADGSILEYLILNGKYHENRGNED